MPIANAPYNPITTPIVACSICRNAQTIARSATSETLKRWHVVSYPTNCICPKCAISKPPEPPPPKKSVIMRDHSISHKYYRAAQQLGEFSTSDIKKCDLPNLHRAGSYLWGLVKRNKLASIGPSRFKIIE
jgi:hypothetical protein